MLAKRTPEVKSLDGFSYSNVWFFEMLKIWLASALLTKKCPTIPRLEKNIRHVSRGKAFYFEIACLNSYHESIASV